MQRKGRVKIQRLMVNGRRYHIGIAVADFNADITGKLLAGALAALTNAGVQKNDIRVVHVPGSFELPLACQKLAKTGKYDALVALGCVIKGETDHYHYVAGEASRGVMDVMLKFDIPIGFGILTTNTLEQAIARSGKKIDAGGSAAKAALRMVSP